jgi:uncharacterized tellurite resistance protein B-like protein
MFDGLRRFVLQRLSAPAPPPTPERRGAGPSDVQLAACALLLEIAYADDEFQPAEREYVAGALRRHFGLDDGATRELVELAEAGRREAVDDYQSTRILTERLDLGQRMVLAEVMWGVILADGHVAEHESHLVRKLGNLLDLEPGYLAQARRAATQRG